MAARIPGGEENVVNDGVERILRVEFAVEMSRQALVLQNRSDLFAMLHDETDDAGRGRGGEQNDQAQSAHQAPFMSSMGVIRGHVCPQW